MSKKDQIWIGLQPNGELKTPLDPDATNIVSPPVSTEGLTMEREDMEYDETLGSRAPSVMEYGGRIYSGDIEAAVRAKSFGVFLSTVFGEPVTTTLLAPAAGPPAVPGVYKHVWNPVLEEVFPLPASLWTLNRDPSPYIVDKYVGFKGNELSLEVETNAYYTYTLAGIAAMLDQTADVVPFDADTAPAGYPVSVKDTSRKLDFKQVKAYITIGTGAETVIPLMDYGFSYNNNIVEDQYVLGSGEVEDLPEGNIEPEVTFTPARNIDQHYRRALLDTPEDVRLRTRATGPVITGAHRYVVEVDLKRIQYMEAPVEIDSSETLRGVEVTAVPVLTDAGALLEVTLINDEDGSNYRPPPA